MILWCHNAGAQYCLHSGQYKIFMSIINFQAYQIDIYLSHTLNCYFYCLISKIFIKLINITNLKKNDKKYKSKYIFFVNFLNQKIIGFKQLHIKFILKTSSIWIMYKVEKPKPFPVFLWCSQWAHYSLFIGFLRSLLMSNFIQIMHYLLFRLRRGLR